MFWSYRDRKGGGFIVQFLFLAPFTWYYEWLSFKIVWHDIGWSQGEEKVLTAPRQPASGTVPAIGTMAIPKAGNEGIGADLQTMWQCVILPENWVVFMSQRRQCGKEDLMISITSKLYSKNVVISWLGFLCTGKINTHRLVWIQIIPCSWVGIFSLKCVYPKGAHLLIVWWLQKWYIALFCHKEWVMSRQGMTLYARALCLWHILILQGSLESMDLTLVCGSALWWV